jgi:hypothetical protein
VGAELIHHARSERRLGAHHRQADFLGLGPGAQLAHIGNSNVLELVRKRRATVARRHEYLGHLG